MEDFNTLPQLLDFLGDLLTRTGTECVAMEKRHRFEREIATDISRLVVSLSTSAKTYCNGSWESVEQDWQEIRAEAAEWEKAVRIRELENPSTEADIRANLFWVIERGVEDDLGLLQRLKSNPLFNSEEFLHLLNAAIERIRSRSESGDLIASVRSQGEDTYQRHKDEWSSRYAGEYIAIYQGEVVASDVERAKLTEKVLKKQRELGPFRAYVVQIENPQMIQEEIRDLTNYLDGIPSALRSSGAFIAYESRLERLQQRLAQLKNIGDVEGIDSDTDLDKPD